MATSEVIESKLIDDLQELGKLNGTEMTIVTNGEQTRKVMIDTIIGYAASLLATEPVAATMSLRNNNQVTYSANTGCIVLVPEGEQVPISQRKPGCFYLEETRQTSIRTQINIPTSVKVSGSLGLRRV